MSGPSILPGDSASGGVTPQALAAALQMLQGGSAASAMVPAASLAGGSPWGQPAAAAGIAAQGVLVQFTVPLGQGWAAPVYLLFGPEHAASTAAIAALVGQLHQQGAPVKLYEPKGDGGGGGYGRGGGGGGYGGGRRWRRD